MTAPINSVNSINNAQTPAPVGAFGLGGSKNKLEAGHIVVYPPQKVYKYSVYDELDLGKDRYKEILSSLESKTAAGDKKRTKIISVFNKLINWGIIIGGGVLAYKYRAPLKNFFLNTFNTIAKSIKK